MYTDNKQGHPLWNEDGMKWRDWSTYIPRLILEAVREGDIWEDLEIEEDSRPQGGGNCMDNA